MDEFAPDTFGKLNAADYDATQDPGTTDQTVDFIHDLMGGQGRALELAIGTGRIGLPLAARGIEVSGIEGSPEMVDILRSKPGGADIPVVIGDMADVAIDGPFDHVFLVFNTFFNLLSQDAQVRCMANVAKVLRPGGTFLVETFVPDLTEFTNHQRVHAKNLSRDGVWIDAATHDPVQQRFEYQRVRVSRDGFKLVPFMMRYAYPAEMDLMAQMAGMALRDRFGGWDKRKFDRDAKMHVSVYRKA